MGKVNMVSVSEARAQLAALVEKVNEEQEPYHIIVHSRPRAVLMGEDHYTMLLELVEELEDSLAVLEARAGNESSRPFAEFMQELVDRRGTNVPT